MSDKSTRPGTAPWALPAAFIAGVAGAGRAHDDVTQCITTDEAGFPRVALLGRSEIHVIDESRLIIALWADSTTVLNIRRSSTATLFRVDDGIPTSIQLRCATPQALDASDSSQLVAIDAQVAGVRQDRVDYAAITSVLRFLVNDAESTEARWADLSQRLATYAAR